MFLLMASQPLVETWVLLWFPLGMEGVLEQILPLLWASVSQCYKWWQLCRCLVVMCSRVTSVSVWEATGTWQRVEKFPRRHKLPTGGWLVLKAQMLPPQKSREPRWRPMRVSGVHMHLASSFNHLLFWSLWIGTVKILPGWVSVSTLLQLEVNHSLLKCLRLLPIFCFAITWDTPMITSGAPHCMSGNKDSTSIYRKPCRYQAPGQKASYVL